MTTLTQTWTYTCSFCDKIGLFFKKVYKKIMLGMQMSANQRVARELVHLGFHQQKEYNQILKKMNETAMEEYNQK